MTRIFTPILVMLFFGHWASAQTWLTSHEEALGLAQRSSKNIILVFSGSDWCAPCVRLKKEVLSSSEFETFVKDFVLLNADFPRKRIKDKELINQNESLAEKFNQKGVFPYIVILNDDGEKIGSLTYGNEQPQGFIEKIQQAIVVR